MCYTVKKEFNTVMNGADIKFRFIDLFSGIGGFHQALTQLGGKCVFASEIDPYAIETYKENYGIDSNINIRDVKVEEIPHHDVLCAGFPCQTFSKAGKQEGFEDSTKGTLFFEIERILEYHHTKYIILENVRNLVSHDNGNTWRTIQKKLKKLGYRTTDKPLLLSPHYFGTPQIRERVIIAGYYDPSNIEFPIELNFEFTYKTSNSIDTILEANCNDPSYNITEDEQNILNMWDEFYQGIKQKTIGYPIWVDYFKTKPSESMPSWKKNFIIKNNTLYQDNKSFIDKWLVKYDNLSYLNPTQRKMEWQAGTSISSIWEGIIQIRPSGIRVKRPDNFQTLVAIVQIPIVGKYKRRLTVREAARLQDFPDSFIPNKNRQQAYKQFGNAVNVKVIKNVATRLFEYR